MSRCRNYASWCEETDAFGYLFSASRLVFVEIGLKPIGARR
jgi:hypothetical protein